MTTIIHAPGDLVVANSGGVDIRFAGLVTDAALPPSTGRHGEKGIRVMFQGVRGPRTMTLDSELHQARSAWDARRREVGVEAAGRPPAMPGVSVLERVGVQVTDDAGTDYRWAGGQIAGDGTDWDASWSYFPEPPEEATTLTLAFTLDGEPTGKECVARLSRSL